MRTVPTDSLATLFENLIRIYWNIEGTGIEKNKSRMAALRTIITDKDGKLRDALRYKAFSDCYFSVFMLNYRQKGERNEKTS